MASRRVIKGVLGNFLGTYVSRYSDYEGNWLFEFLVDDLGELRINLLGQSISDPETPIGVAVAFAAAKFEEQLRKSGLTRSQVREAWLTIRKLPGVVHGTVNGRACTGANLSFLAEAVMEDGRCNARKQIVFVVPHNPNIEQRSTRVAATDDLPSQSDL
jgi:hypothetical protein